MAKKSPKEVGQEFLAKILEHVPEAARAQVSQALGTDPALHALGEGALSRAESSRLYDELRQQQREADAKIAQAQATHDANTRWYGERSQDLARFDELKRSGTLDRMIAATNNRNGGDPDDPGDPDEDDGGSGSGSRGRSRRAPAIDTSRFITKEDLPQLLQNQAAPMVRNLQAQIQFIPSLVVKHSQEFSGDVLNVTELIQFCNKTGYQNLEQGYEAFVHERRTEVFTEKQKELVAAAEKRGEEAALAKLRAQGVPWPIATGKPEELGALETAIAAGKESAGKFGASQAASYYLDKVHGSPT
jgi:phosphoglycolate phosphatase-like HAD superfamily hydrolase